MTNDHQLSLHHHVRPQAGESAPFHFENRWRVNASVRDVWSVLSDIEAWPQWWPSLPVAVPIDDTIATGSRADIQVDSPIGVTLSFSIELQETEAPYFVIFSAAGDLRGTGALVAAADRLHHHDQLSVVRDHSSAVDSAAAAGGDVDALTSDESRTLRSGQAPEPSRVLKPDQASMPPRSERRRTAPGAPSLSSATA